MTFLGLLAVVVAVFALVSRVGERVGVTPPMAFVAAGVLVGPGLLDFLDVPLEDPALLLVAEVALVLVLFSDASRVKVHALRGAAGLPARLLILGMPLTIAAGAGAGALLLTDLAFWEAAIVGAVLAPTDAALGQAVLSDRSVPVRVRQALNVESGLNDGLSVPFLTLFVALAASESGVGSAGHWARFAAEQIGFGMAVGAAVGLAGGRVLESAVDRGWATGVFQQLAALSLAVGAWAAAGAVGGNGFIAAFVAGLLAAVVMARCVQHLVEFTEDEGQLLNLAVFFFFGALLPELLRAADWRVALYAALSLTVIRAVPVAIALLGMGLRPSSVAFVGWFGPRGLASIILALVVVEEQAELPGLETILAAMAMTVLASIVTHGVSARPLAKRFGHAAKDLPPHAEEHRPAPDLPTRPRGEGEPAAVGGHAATR